MSAAAWSRMREWSATSCVSGEPRRVGADGRFVFAVGGDRQRRLGEDAFERRLLVDEQVAGAGADEDLDAGRAVGRLQLVEVVARRADVEAVVDERLLGRERELFFDAGLRDRGRHGVRHFEKRRDAALGTRAAGGGEIFFVREARLAEVDLVVDRRRAANAGRRRRSTSSTRSCGGRVDVGDLRAFDHDRAAVDAVGKDDGRVFDEGSHAVSVAQSRRERVAIKPRRNASLSNENIGRLSRGASRVWRFGNGAACGVAKCRRRIRAATPSFLAARSCVT